MWKITEIKEEGLGTQIKNLIKLIIKRMTCKHLFIQDTKMYGNSNRTGKEIVISYKFKCSKCGKEVRVNMDEQYQIDMEERNDKN